MSTLDEFLANEGAGYDPARGKRPEHPKGWEPGVIFEGDAGTIVTRPGPERDPRWDQHLKDWGFDPGEFEVLDPVQVRTWDAPIGGGKVQQMWYYRANIIRRIAGGLDLDALGKWVLRQRPRKRVVEYGDGALVVPLSDWQLGKRDGGGSAGVAGRVLDLAALIPARAKELRRLGRPVSDLVLAGIGDLFEGCDGFYPMQAFNVDLNRRDQHKLVRRLLTKLFVATAPHFRSVTGITVPGNHGEERKDGKAYTDFADNTDVAVFEDVWEVLRQNPAYDNVGMVIPDDELSVTLEVAGQVLGFAHGHTAKGGGGSPEARIERWWKGQQHGRQPVGDADILVTGHFHHLIVKQNGPRTWLQCPALEGGSDWYTATSGIASPAGTLSFLVSSRGWSDLEVLR